MGLVAVFSYALDSIGGFAKLDDDPPNVHPVANDGDIGT
jgi:hypothetical protein